jgi:hypothetical protein
MDWKSCFTCLACMRPNGGDYNVDQENNKAASSEPPQLARGLRISEEVGDMCFFILHFEMCFFILHYFLNRIQRAVAHVTFLLCLRHSLVQS